VALFTTTVLGRFEFSVSASVDTPKGNFFDRLFNFGQLPNGEKITPLDYLLQDVLPPLLGQRPNNENGTREEFKNYAFTDRSNDDAVHLTPVSSTSL